MIMEAVREVTQKPVRITVSIPGGEEIARRTFNPRLGIEGGLSILGTTGIVRPYSHSAIRETLKCTMDVCLANGVRNPILTAGNIGTKAAHSLFPNKHDEVVEAGNEWGFLLKNLVNHNLDSLLIIGHPGKLAKLAIGEWDTHSSRSKSALPFVLSVAGELSLRFGEEPGTVEGVFAELGDEKKNALAGRLSNRIRSAVVELTNAKFTVDVVLVDMAGKTLGHSEGDLSGWRR
jgi:cobalt-precorrin-5B (C1)-methyltransferase